MNNRVVSNIDIVFDDDKFSLLAAGVSLGCCGRSSSERTLTMTQFRPITTWEPIVAASIIQSLPICT